MTPDGAGNNVRFTWRQRDSFFKDANGTLISAEGSGSYIGTSGTVDGSTLGRLRAHPTGLRENEWPDVNDLLPIPGYTVQNAHLSGNPPPLWQVPENYVVVLKGYSSYENPKSMGDMGDLDSISYAIGSNFSMLTLRMPAGVKFLLKCTRFPTPNLPSDSGEISKDDPVLLDLSRFKAGNWVDISSVIKTGIATLMKAPYSDTWYLGTLRFT